MGTTMTDARSEAIRKLHAQVDRIHADDWLHAWGWNAPQFPDEYDHKLPTLPDCYEWELRREVIGGKPKLHVSLWHDTGDTIARRIDHGRIDVELYGHTAIIELAHNIKERQEL
jgi:hypothetical protein